MKKETRGRKPVDDPKMTVAVGLPMSVVNNYGGKEKVREKIVKFLCNGKTND